MKPSEKSIKQERIRPQLSIDTKALSKEELESRVFEETDRYSITPTTFKSRHLKTNLDFEKTVSKTKFDIEEKEKKLFLIDEEINKIKDSLLLLKNTGVLSEGELKGCVVQMNGQLFELLATKQSELRNQQNALELYFVTTNEIAQKEFLSYEDRYENTQGQSVTRYGINLTEGLSHIAKEYNSSLELLNPKVILEDPSVSSGKKKGAKSNQSNKDEQANITLHPLEVINLQNAINYLNAKEENKTVLIDIFARDSQTGMIKWQEDNPLLPETHTVVLFKNSEKQLVAIDPSNSSFSKHLSINTKMLISDDIEILVPQKELRIYEQDKKIGTGSEPHKYRDCIDIAVKIAFGLSKIEKVDQNKIEFLEVIQEVTNQEDVNKNLFFSKQDSIARIRQASNDEVRKLSEKILNNIDKQIKSAHLHNFSKLEQQILNDSIEVLKKPYTPEQYSLGLDDLFNFCHATKELLQASINEIETSIQGDINHYIEGL